MSERISEVLDQIEARQQSDFGMIDGANALAFLQAIYRDRQAPLSVRMKAAIEALPFESPKLSATAIVQGQDFAALLEARLKRTQELAPPHAKALAVEVPDQRVSEDFINPARG